MKNRLPRAGFTLVETLVTLGIISGVLLLVGLMGRDVFAFRSGLSDALSTQSDARRVLRPFSDEVRAASYSEAGAYPLAETSTSSVTFFSDVDRDGVAERVRYFLEGGTFRRSVAEPSGNPAVYGAAATTTLVSGVLASTTIFWYYGAGYDGATSSPALAFPVSPSEARAVRVWLRVDGDLARAPGPADLTTVSTVRNLRGLGSSQ